MIRDTARPTKQSVSIGYSDVKLDTYYRGGIKGEIRYTYSDPENGESTCGSLKNIVTLDAGVLIARLMKDKSEPSYGIYALAVGTGSPSWTNPLSPPPANVNQRSLWNEIARKTAASTQFIDSNGNISGIPTNVVDFNFSFGPGQAVGPLTEMGLIGGDVSSNLNERNPVTPPNGIYDPNVDLVGKDTLCNYLTFPVINKSVTGTLTWTWRLTF